MDQPIHIIGGGLAGTEAAWQIARRGMRTILHEMRPVRRTPAHQTDRLAELVCSNSLKSESESTAPWLLKEELRRLDSLLLQAAQKVRVPGGHALTVDREGFASEITAAIANEPLIELRREEVTAIPDGAITVIATGPLTSDALAADIARLTGSDRLFFYDSISPIVDADTVDTSIAFWASRYGKSTDGTDDYLNCPFDREQYDALRGRAAERPKRHRPHRTRIRRRYFEACLPIEEIARRGRDTLRFGPMKPMGLTDPRTGKRPYAVVQLRQENLRAQSFNLVGFQNHLQVRRAGPHPAHDPRPAERRVPALRPDSSQHLHQRPRAAHAHAATARPSATCFFAGQISGVEGYVEAIATGLMAGMHAAALAAGEEPATAAARNRARLAVPLHFRRRSPRLSARQHHLRPAAAARRRHPPEARAATSTRATPKSAAAPSKRSIPMQRRPPMSELARHIERYLQDLAAAGNSAHTLTAYSADLAEFLEFLSPPDTAPPDPPAIDLLTLREWLLWLYNRPNTAVTIRRKLAAVRGLFKFLLREGIVTVNVARLVRTPKAAQEASRRDDAPSRSTP